MTKCPACEAREINDSPLRGYDGMVDRFEKALNERDILLDECREVLIEFIGVDIQSTFYMLNVDKTDSAKYVAVSSFPLKKLLRKLKAKK